MWGVTDLASFSDYFDGRRGSPLDLQLFLPTSNIISGPRLVRQLTLEKKKW
jgi:hypothetical protein